MALDIRLDFITNINPLSIEEMTKLRKDFMQIDEILKIIADKCEVMKKDAGKRTIALSRTNLEIALQFAIKSLCIIGEMKGDNNGN